ncbi:MAG: hypothetical protein ACOYLR_13835 [Chlorobium sp.]
MAKKKRVAIYADNELSAMQERSEAGWSGNCSLRESWRIRK